MKKESTTNVLSTLLAVSGMLLIIWWLLLGLSQIAGGGGDSLAKLALTSSWVPINIAGLLSTLLLILGLIGILTGNTSELGALGFVGVVLSISGAALFTALQFDETFVWPLLATHAEGLLEIEGPMFTDPAFVASYLVMGIVFAVGFVFVAAQSLKHRIFPVVPSVFLLAGALLFAGGILVPVIIRTIGVVLLGVSLIWVGFKNKKRSA
jgi:hypothetical protein